MPRPSPRSLAYPHVFPKKQSQSGSGNTRAREDIVGDALKKQVWAKTRGQCQYCLEFGFIVEGTIYDHIIPISKAGGTTLENLQLLCNDCNYIKTLSDKDMITPMKGACIHGTPYSQKKCKLCPDKDRKWAQAQLRYRMIEDITARKLEQALV